MSQALIWQEGYLSLLDQTRLPGIITYIECRDYQTVAQAIRDMQVRGAPAIGAAAAYGVALAALSVSGEREDELIRQVQKGADELAQTRPTAVNLFWAIKRMQDRLNHLAGQGVEAIRRGLVDEAVAIHAEDLEMNRRMGRLGQELIPHGARILTHCNAGALATGGYGTALGVIRAAQEAGKNVSVFADETRPLLQGARLTAFELMEDDIPVTLVSDNMAGYLMAKKMVDLVIVGADRIAQNGDAANKIGTYGVAVLAAAHGLPFYVAAPYSTVDLALRSGEEIPIEERHADEVRKIGQTWIAPPDVPVFNPAFDVTPARLITAIITDRGVIRPPYIQNLKQAMEV